MTGITQHKRNKKPREKYSARKCPEQTTSSAECDPTSINSK